MVQKRLSRQAHVVREEERLNRTDFSTVMQKKKNNKGNNSSGGEKSEFKIALAAMTTLEDFQAPQEQFSDLKE